MTSSASLSGTGRQDIDMQLGMELTSPTNVTGGWSDLSGTTPVQSQLGSGIGTVHPHDISGAPTMPFNVPPFPSAGHAPISMQSGPPPVASNPGLSSRSGSFSHPNPQNIMYGINAGNASVHSLDQAQQQMQQSQPPPQQHSPPDFVPSQGGRARGLSRATTSGRRSPSSSSYEEDGDSDYEGYGVHGQSTAHSKSSPPLRSRPGSPHRRASAGNSASPGENQPTSSGSGSGNEIPPEYRADVDRIFFEFLNKVCSNCR